MTTLEQAALELADAVEYALRIERYRPATTYSLQSALDRYYHALVAYRAAEQESSNDRSDG